MSSNFKYQGIDLDEFFQSNIGTQSNVNFSPFPDFSKTNDVYQTYKTSEIEFPFSNNGTNLLDQKFIVSNAKATSSG